MRIYVRDEHIRLGMPAHNCECPVALALREALSLKNRDDVDVMDDGGVAVFLRDSSGRGTWYAHESATVESFVYSFDRGEPVVPFAFNWPTLEKRL